MKYGIGVETELRQLTEWALAEGRGDIIRWLFARLMTPEKATLWAITCVRRVCEIQEWIEWAEKWESGTDRRIQTAQETTDSLWELAEDCLWSTTEVQARSAAHATEAAIYALGGSRVDVADSVYVATGIAASDSALRKNDADVVSETRWQIDRAYELFDV